MKKFSIASAALIALCVAVLWFVAEPRMGEDPHPVQVRIPKGSSQKQIVQLLVENGAITSPATFKALSKLSGKSFRHGTYLLERNRYIKTLRQLRSGQTLRVKVTFPEGWSTYQVAERLAAAGILTDPEAFAAIVKTSQLEGKLYPETYYFEPGAEPESVISEMARQFQKMYDPDLEARAAELGWSEKKVLTMASIIEREARVPSERPMISSVYHNRLKRRKLLEADPTVQYAIHEGREWKDRLTYKDLNNPSPYNTYRKPGLPPGPICNPGIESIRAALYPAESPYLYFVADPDGSGIHHFTQTYEQHLQVQKDLRRKRRLRVSAEGVKSR